MGDQEADIQRIRDCSRSLKRIHDTFDKRANPADGYGTSELGSQTLIDTFSDFGDNWKIHREQLASALKKLSKLTDTAADTYDKTDHDLAAALRDTDAKGKKK